MTTTEINYNPSTHYDPPSPQEKGKYTCCPCKIILYLASKVTQAVRWIISFFPDWLGCSKKEIVNQKLNESIQPTPASRPLEDTPVMQLGEDQIKWLEGVKNETITEEEFKKGLEKGYYSLQQTVWLGKTILHIIACKGTSINRIKPLIDAGLNPSSLDRDYKNTALQWAIANGKNLAALTIIEATPEDQLGGFNNQSMNENTALHLSIGKGYTTITAGGELLPSDCPNLRITTCLLQKGANANLKNKQGNTPLHIAALRHDLDSIKLLLQYGADQNATNKDGKTALELLDVGYDKAQQIIRTTVSYFILDQPQYETNLENCRQLLTNPNKTI